jgi:hypothetical protein
MRWITKFCRRSCPIQVWTYRLPDVPRKLAGTWSLQPASSRQKRKLSMKHEQGGGKPSAVVYCARFSQYTAIYLFRLQRHSAGFLLCSIFHPEYEGVFSFETSGSFQTTRHYNLEDHIVHSHSRDSFKSNESLMRTNTRHVKMLSWFIFICDMQKYASSVSSVPGCGCLFLSVKL